jgi:hypothetical protein
LSGELVRSRVKELLWRLSGRLPGKLSRRFAPEEQRELSGELTGG